MLCFLYIQNTQNDMILGEDIMVYCLYMHILGQQSSFEEIAIYR